MNVEGIVLLLPADSEQRSLENEQVPPSYKFREILDEESKHQHPDVHSVHIGIGCDYHSVVSEVLYVFLDIQGGLKQVEFLVVIVVDNLLGTAVGVHRLSPEGENSLGISIPCL